MEMMMEELKDKVINDELLGNKATVHCRCTESEDGSKKLEARCGELELQIEKQMNEFETLEAKFKAIVAEKLALENRLKSLNQSESLGRIVDLTEENEEEEDAAVQLMMENTVLELEKKRAEIEADTWKEKFEKLKLVIQKLHEIGVLGYGEWESDKDIKLGLGLVGIDLPIPSERKKTSSDLKPEEPLGVTGFERHQISDSPRNFTPNKDALEERRCKSETRVGCGDQVRKRLAFEEDKSPRKKMAPFTEHNAVLDSLNIIDILDSDEEPKNAKVSNLTGNTLKPTGGNEQESSSENVLKENYEDKDFDLCEENTKLPSAHKRKRVINSDSEIDDEDNIPICKLRRKLMDKQSLIQESSIGDENVSKRPLTRRLASLRQREQKCGSSKNPSVKELLREISSNEDFQDEESEDGSESESESLNGFIVEDESTCDDDDSEMQHESDCVDESTNDTQNESDADMKWDEVISRIRRKKDSRSSKWEFEGDMLADFGKDPELCMRAVCVLYRMQTSDEKELKSTHHHNQRGFSKFDANRGTALGEFLTEGDPEGDMVKSVEDLLCYDPEAAELCRTLAIRYSKQLFEIYKNREDPFFLPS